jgi:Bacterial pre-peptidase C-terminal domain
MSKVRSNSRQALLSITFLTLLAITAFVHPAAAQDCQSALGSSTGAISLSNAATTTRTKGVDEWDVEVIKIATTFPGVIEVTGTGDDAQDSVYTQGSTETHPLVDSATLATGSRTLRVVVPAGLHCIQVAPSEDATGDYEVAATFTDACHLNDTDDHGDSFLCATPIAVGGTDSGEITSSVATDYDMFQFVVASSGSITVASTGTGHVTGMLYDGTGALLASDNTDGSAANFSIISSLSAGTYYVRISGADESSYGIGVSATP